VVNAEDILHVAVRFESAADRTLSGFAGRLG